MNSIIDGKWKWKQIYLYQMLRYSSYINTKYGNTINPSSSMFFSFWCFVEMKERGKVHWFLAAGGQNRPVQTRNYSISLHRRHNIHIQQLSNSKGWWKKCFWMYQLTNIFMMRRLTISKICIPYIYYIWKTIFINRMMQHVLKIFNYDTVLSYQLR